jgi:4-hydroxy-tetrahydrodipicolinate synthase
LTFEGVIPATVTLFRSDGSVDLAALKEHVAWLIGAGSTAIVALGTMGEAHSLSAEERRDVLSAIAPLTGDSAMLIAGISSDSAEHSRRWAGDAADAGAQALMCLPPVTYQADDREVVSFFEDVAGATDLPLIVYNNPGASRVDLSAELVTRLADIPAVEAVKECSGDARRISAILERAGDRLDVLVGGDDWALEGFCAGAVGWISGCANVAPKECVDLFERCSDGDLKAARDMNHRLLPLARLDMEPKLVQYFKLGMEKVGRYGGPVRPPRMPLTDPELAQVEYAVNALSA